MQITVIGAGYVGFCSVFCLLRASGDMLRARCRAMHNADGGSVSYF